MGVVGASAHAHRRRAAAIDMNETQKYNAARLLETLGYMSAVNYCRNCGLGYDEAICAVDEIAEQGL